MIVAPPFAATVTPPDSLSAREEREASCFATSLWGETGKCPTSPRRFESGSARRRCRVIDLPIEPPTIIDRETGAILREPRAVARIGKWSTRAKKL